MLGQVRRSFLAPSNPVISVLYVLINLFYHDTQAREGCTVVTDKTRNSRPEQELLQQSRFTGNPCTGAELRKGPRMSTGERRGLEK